VHDEAADHPDGRRRRSGSTRASIVEAMLDLVEGGDVAPGAARVAARAGVGLRSVFRHFEDMDSLYREMGTVVQGRVLPAFLQPYRATDWQGKLAEMVERRIGLYEAVLPFKFAADLRHRQSEYLARDYQQFHLLELTSLEAVLPAEVRRDRALLAALLAATGFQTWKALRKDQGFDVATSRAAVQRTVRSLLGPAAASKAARAGRPASRKSS
jgi:AcrR family transcriptional regulator